MKRKNKYVLSLLVLTVAAFMTGCYKDKSTLATNPINGVVIDTAGMSGPLYVDYAGRITLSPSVTKDGVKNPDNLIYEWSMSVNSTSPEYVVLGDEIELDTVITHPIATTPYDLVLKVNDPENGLDTYMNWKIYVRSAFVDGLLIADSKDGVTSDMTFIKNKSLTTNYTGEEVIYRNVFATAGKTYDRLISSLAMVTVGSTTGGTHTNYVLGTDSEGSLIGFDFMDLSELEPNEVAIYMSPSPVQDILYISQTLLVPLADGSVYGGLQTASTIPFSVPYTTVLLNASNGVFVSIPTRGVGYNALTFYDKENATFRSYQTHYLPPYLLNITLQPTTDPFDITNLPGKTAVDGGFSIDGNRMTFLMKDDATGEYAIYALSKAGHDGYSETSPTGAYLLRNIPAEGKSLLDRAVATAFAYNEAVLYVAVEEGIYAMPFLNTNVSVTSVYTPDAGEKITGIKLYRQGLETVDTSAFDKGIQELALNNKALVVMSLKNDTEGKVSVVPMVRLGSGELDKNSALVYDGFGKVLDVIGTIY